VDYRKLRSMLRNDYNLRVLFRRAISCAAEMDAMDAAGAEALANQPGQGSSECGHNPG
jgi:hypothetical protein